MAETTYDKQTLEAYAKAYEVINQAYWRKNRTIAPTLYDKCQTQPALGFTELYLKAIRERVLNDTDNQLIAMYLDEVPGDFKVTSERVSNEQQGVWVLAAWGKRIHTLTPSEVAEQLGVTVQMVSKLIRQGKLDAVKVDGHWLVSQHSVTMYKDRQRK